IGVLPAQDPRPAPQLRGGPHARLVRRRRRRAGAAAQAVDLPGPRRPQAHLLVPAGRAGAAHTGRAPPRHPPGSPGRSAVSTLAPTLQAFFTDRLARKRQASGHPIAAYRDALKLLLAFACKHTGKPPSHLDIADLDAPLISAFLDHPEHHRANSARTANARPPALPPPSGTTRLSARPSPPPSTIAATARGPATPAWPPSPPCSASPPCATPRT